MLPRLQQQEETKLSTARTQVGEQQRAGRLKSCLSPWRGLKCQQGMSRTQSQLVHRCNGLVGTENKQIVPGRRCSCLEHMDDKLIAPTMRHTFPLRMYRTLSFLWRLQTFPPGIACTSRCRPQS